MIFHENQGMESPPFMKNKEKEWGSWREGGKKKKNKRERKKEMNRV